MNRPINEMEKALLIQGIQHLIDKNGELDVFLGWMEELDQLRVVYQCNCGEPDCHTVHFQHFASGTSVGIYHGTTEDGRMYFIHMNEETYELSEIEII